MRRLHEKRWETVGTPRLLVIGPYQMDIEITPTEHGSRVRVSLDYELPTGVVGKCLGRLSGGVCANWCITQMLSGVSREFGVPQTRIPDAIMKT